MTRQARKKGAPQHPEAPKLKGAAAFGERREPAGDPAKYDKHGGSLDHDGKQARSQEPPNKRKQNLEEEGRPTEHH